MIRLASSERGTATSSLNAEPSRTITVLAPFIKRKLKWRESEKSIGKHLRSYGTSQCWQAIGPARQTFLQLGEEIKAHLEQCSEPLPTWVTWSIYMIGRTPATAEPTVIFCSPDTIHRKLIRKTIKRSGILEKYPGVCTGDMSQAPDFDQLVQLAAEASDTPKMTILGITEDYVAAVEVTGLTGETRRATIGGAVELSGRLFYMSVLHALMPDSTLVKATDDGQSEYSFDGTETDDEDVIETSDSSFGAIDELVEVLPAGSDTGLAQVEHGHSAQRPLYDITLPYACTILTRDGTHPGSFVFTPTGLESIGLDYALLVQNHENQPYGSPRPQWPDLKPAEANYFLVDSHDVYILKSNSTRVMGKFSGTPAYTISSGHSRFQLSYPIELETQLQKGDSGAWVYDKKSNDLIGIVASGCLSSKRAYIVPAYQVFEDLRRQSRNPGLQKLLQPVSILPPPYSHVIRLEPEIESEVSQACSAVASTPSAKGKSAITSTDALHTTLSKHVRSANGLWFEKWFENHPHGSMDDGYAAWRAAKEQMLKGTSVERYLSLPIVFPSECTEINDELASAMTFSFRQLLSHVRLQHLLFPGGARTPPEFGSDRDPSPSLNQATILEAATRRRAIRNLPIYPVPPLGPREIKFQQVLWTFSEVPLKWENPSLLDEALQNVPLDIIYEDAEQESQLMEVNALEITAASLKDTKPAWSYQDCVVRALMRWFKSSFFSWVNDPPCSDCGQPTRYISTAAAVEDERASGANQVELYRCTSDKCCHYERFARYNDAFTLMRTRRGRVGEWATCFGMLCRAMGIRVRLVWSSEDNAWVEIFSDYRKRWVSVDVCEQAFDKPLLYTQGWRRKLAYAIAFSSEGASDVTGRYVWDPTQWQAKRSRATEPALAHVLQEITNHRRQNMRKDEVKRLVKQDMRERKEILTCITVTCTLNLCTTAFRPRTSSSRDKGGRTSLRDVGSDKAAEARQELAAANRSGSVKHASHSSDNGANNGAEDGGSSRL